VFMMKSQETGWTDVKAQGQLHGRDQSRLQASRKAQQAIKM